MSQESYEPTEEIVDAAVPEAESADADVAAPADNASEDAPADAAEADEAADVETPAAPA